MPGAAIGAAASIGGALISKSGSDSAAGASSAASAASIKLAKEQRDKNEKLFAPYIDRENKAQAYLDAMTYGEGSYAPYSFNPNAASSGSGSGSGGGGSSSSGGGGPTASWLSGGLGAILAQTALGGLINPALLGGSNNNNQPAPAPAAPPAAPTTVNRSQALANLYNQPLWQMNEADLAAREGIIDDTYAGLTGLNDTDLAATRGGKVGIV